MEPQSFWRRCGIFLTVLLITSAAAWAGVPAAKKPALLFQRDSLPDPPSQNQPWASLAATQLPASFVQAARELFALGLADPRGCEYRKVEIVAGDVWGGQGAVIKVHAWVLPAIAEAKSDGVRFAVAWNGLVYPTVSVGDQADLKADVDSACAADEAMRQKWSRENSNGSFYRYRNAMDEQNSASEQTLAPLKACLLLRLGETALAEHVWSDWTGGMDAKVNDDASHLKDPFLMLAGDWLWARFDRAVTAHMRGDDRLAEVGAKALVAVQKEADNAAEKHGFQKNTGRVHPPTTYFEFLEPAAELELDSHRRITEPARVHVLEVGEEKFPDQTKRIAALIADLDQVSARQWGQPGGVDLGDDPVVEALIREGEPAVEPLLDCLENDDRLTRSVHFWRDFARERSLIGVHEAAYVALSGILGQSFFAPQSTGDDLSAREAGERAGLVKAIREYWDKYKAMPKEQRWFAVLADDNAKPSEWLQAAANITQPVDVRHVPSSMIAESWTEVPQREPGKPIPLRGDALRKSNQPGVSDLLIKRLVQLSNAGDDPSDQKLNSACELADALIAWDGAAHKDVLRNLSDVLLQRSGKLNRQGSYLVRPIVSLYAKRIELGDDTALKQYARWVVTVTPAQAQTDADFLFEILWKHSADPIIAGAAEKLFNAEGSPWNPIMQKGVNNAGYYARDILSTPVVGVPAMRKQLLGELANVANGGTVKITEEGGMVIESPWGSSSSSMADRDDPFKPRANTPMPFRTCDMIARQLAQIPGFPRIELYWPQEQRDAAVKISRQLLEQYGSRLEWTPLQDKIKVFSPPVMTFAPLDHPATAQEVAAGNAIFSADGQSRVWKLPSYPLKAIYPQLHTMPATSQGWDTVLRKPTYAKIWNQEGYIWQAEEILEDGHWKRYFGFVGLGFMGKVPADQIELLPADFWQWSSLASGIRWQLQAPGTTTQGGYVTVTLLPFTDPLPIQIRFRNTLGVTQNVPTDWYHATDHTLREGVELHLQHDAGDGSWEEISPRYTARFTPTDAHASLEPMEQVLVATIDLQSFFNIDKAGQYRVRLLETKPLGGPFESIPCEAIFSLGNPPKSNVKK